MIDAHRDRPNPIIEVLPQASPGPPKYPKLLKKSHCGPYMQSCSFSLLYICLHCDEVSIVLIRWHFGTLCSANGPPGPPKHEQKSCFGGFVTSNIYKYIYIFHNLIHIYGVKFILNIPGALKHNIQNVEVFR